MLQLTLSKIKERHSTHGLYCCIEGEKLLRCINDDYYTENFEAVLITKG